MKFFLIILVIAYSSHSLAYHAKYPFLTLRKSTNIDSTPITTVTCAAKVKVLQAVGEKWVKVNVARKNGYVYKKLLIKDKSSCMSKGRSLLLNSLSLSANEIYLWAKLGEHLIEGDLNDY